MKKTLLALLLALFEILSVCSLAACKTTQTPQTTQTTLSDLPTMSLSEFSETLTSDSLSPTSEAPRVGVSGVTFERKELTLRVGTGAAVSAHVLPENATNRGITYSVTDPNVISYDDGVLTALAEGQAQLVARTEEDGYIARLTVNVTAGEVPTPTPSTTEPSVSTTPLPTETSPAPVTTTPVVTPTPVVRVTGISLETTSLELTVGDKRSVSVRVQPDDAADKSYSVTVTGTAASCENGVVTALAQGSAKIVFRTKDGGYTATLTVNVTKKQGEDIPNAFRYDENGLPSYTPAFDPEIDYYDFNPKNTYHLFCHNLVAFDDPDDYFYSDCITVTEFRRILDQLYERGYILIDIDYMYEYSWSGGLLNARIKDSIKLPRGKKAIILSVDNVCYPRSEHGRGRCDRLQVVNGKLMTYTKMPDGTDLYSDDNEVFTILEKFVKAHPDFSFAGAKCVVAPSGYEGLFGWDTVPGSANYTESVAEAKKIVSWFNANGFVFACHSYYHKDFKTMTVAQIENDVKHWRDECCPIVGRTHIFIYPFGSFTEKNSDQAKALNAAGYAVFCATSYYAATWNDFPLPGNCYNERVTLASKLFKTKANDATLAKLFDVYTVYENEAHSEKLYKN